MTNRIHKMRKRVHYADNSKPPYWLNTDAHGWLASGLHDRNGKEIFEGDIVHNCFNAAVVVFENGSFYLNGSDLYSYVRDDLELEVIGHIAEEQQ